MSTLREDFATNDVVSQDLHLPVSPFTMANRAPINQHASAMKSRELATTKTISGQEQSGWRNEQTAKCNASVRPLAHWLLLHYI